MLDMGGLADHAFHQDDFVHGPGDGGDLPGAEPVAAIVDRDVRFGRGAEGKRCLVLQQVAEQRGLKGTGLGERIAGAQRDGLAVLDPVEGEREGRAVEAVERGDDAREPVGRGVVEIEQRYEGDVEEMRAAGGIVAGKRGDLGPRGGRWLGHDVEGVARAHRVGG